jgi:hypothetical protein
MDMPLVVLLAVLETITEQCPEELEELEELV